MRLISADELDDDLFEKYPMEENISLFSDLIREQPTAYDIDKVVEEMREFKQFCIRNGMMGIDVATRMIEIVKAGGKNDD